MHVDHHGGQWLHIWVVSTTRIVAATCLSSLSNACRLSDQRFIFQAQAKCNLSALHHACIGDIGCHNSFVHGVNRVHQYRMPQLVSLLPRRFCGSDRVRLLGRQCEGPCFNPRLQYHRLKNWVGWWKRCLLQSPTSRKDQYKVTPTYCKDFLLSAARPWKLHWILPCITTMPHNWGNATIPCGRCLCVCLNCSRASDVLCTVLMERLRWVCCQSLEGMSVVDAGNFTVVCRYEFAVGDEVDSSSHAEIVQERFVYFNDMFHLRMRYFFWRDFDDSPYHSRSSYGLWYWSFVSFMLLGKPSVERSRVIIMPRWRIRTPNTKVGSPPDSLRLQADDAWSCRLLTSSCCCASYDLSLLGVHGVLLRNVIVLVHKFKQGLRLIEVPGLPAER